MPHCSTSEAGSPLRHTVDVARGLLLIDLLQIDDLPGVIAAVARIQEDPAFNPDLNICVDCGSLSHVPTPDKVRDFACAYVVQAAPALTGRVAIVASLSWSYDAARHFAIVASGLKARVRVFQSSGEALAWLHPESAPSLLVRQAMWVNHARILYAMSHRPGLPRP